MSENAEKKMMYETNATVRELNKVDGFEPNKYLRKENTEDGVSFYLDTKYRLLWFRLKYPDGKIIKIPKALNKEYATFEVRIYADKNDAEDNFLANGFASRYKDDSNEKFGLNFVESAETAALGRALKDAGFGTQFCDIALPDDQTIVDAGVHISFDLGNDGITTPAEENEAGTAVSSAATSNSNGDATAGNTETETAEEKIELNKDMSIEELLQKMTVDYAKAIVVEVGYDRGKTLGSIMQTKPKSIVFHSTYEKNNNLVRAGALFLIEQAKVA